MKFTAILTIMVLISLSQAAKTCVKVKTTSEVMRSTAGCKPQQVRNAITFTISVPPFTFVIKVTRKCFKENRARRVLKRNIQCVKVFAKRCRCSTTPDKMACVMNAINTCSPQADVMDLSVRAPTTVAMG